MLGTVGRRVKPTWQASLKKVLEGRHGFGAVFFHEPVAGVLEGDDLAVGGDEFALIAEGSCAGFLAGDDQNGHRQFGLRESLEVLRGVEEVGEVGPAGAHASGARIGEGVVDSVYFGDRVSFVGGEVVPE